MSSFVCNIDFFAAEITFNLCWKRTPKNLDKKIVNVDKVISKARKMAGENISLCNYTSAKTGAAGPCRRSGLDAINLPPLAKWFPSIHVYSQSINI